MNYCPALLNTSHRMPTPRMSGTLTPARRRRSVTDVDGEDSSVDDSALSTTSKRARLHGDDDETTNGEQQSPAQPLLPDNFRRSPQTNGRTVNRLPNGSGGGPRTHQPGSIIRVKLVDFVTYTKAEFNLGPNLNMIIGPNGTGKSTLVCAICLGLGWKTSHLGRAKDIGEFVKHGAKRALIEIELAGDPSRHEENQVIRTRITREGNKTEFYINGKKSNNKGVLDLARSFSIQVDNLCQFLPQDRVVEFAALSPIDLLAQTLKAAAPEQMTTWHEELKRMRKEQKQKRMEQIQSTDELKNMENRQRGQEPEVERLRQRSELQDRIAALEKLKPLPEYSVAVRKQKEAKERRKAAEKDYKKLERQMEPNLRAVNEKTEYYEQYDKIVSSRSKLLSRSEQMAAQIITKQNGIDEKIEECLKEIEAERKSMKKTREEIPRLQHSIESTKKAINNPPEPFDPAEMNERIRDKAAAIREIDNRIDEQTEQMQQLKAQGRERDETVRRTEEQMTHLQSQVGRQENKLKSVSRECAQAWDWIQKNRDHFESDVFGPPLVECSVKDPSHATAVESMIQKAEMCAFTVTSRNDFKKLQEQLYGKLKLSDINIRTSTQPLSRFAPPCSAQELERLGLQGWIVDLIEGPEPVLAMLCDNRNIHQTGFTANEITTTQHEQLQRHGSINSWTTKEELNIVTRRREYGDKATSTRVTRLGPARFFTDAPVDRQEETEMRRKITEAQGEMDHIANEIKSIQAEQKTFKARKTELSEQESALKEEKKQKQTFISQFNGLPVKLSGYERKLEEAQKTIDGSRDRVFEITKESDKLALQKGQLTLDYANALDTLRNLHVQLIEAEILQIEAKSDLEQLESRHEEERQLLDTRRQEVEALIEEARVTLARGKELQAICQEIGELNEFEEQVYDEVRTMEPEHLETEIQSVQARLDMTNGSGNLQVLREFEERAKKIERRQAKLAELEATLTELEENITSVMLQWEPQLDDLISHISDAFAENFSKIQCAGEVVVYKDEDDFDQWAIQIKVKFRENETLSILDNHRQSGGERAVSTIFYLMALQSLARAPFRVVDEINQGMDPRNERMVHSRIVDIACGEGSASQYFLITPKLLNGLQYHPQMKVHCIASGEFMPEDHRELDFAMLAKRVLAVRGAA